MRIMDWSSDVCSSDLACRVAPDDVGGAFPPPQVRSVDDIVVEQGGGVDEFDRGGEPVVAVAGIAQQRRARERQHRPHALAAARDQLPGKDRKRVVSGKGGSLRVEHGGRLFLKKKKPT